VSIPNDQRLRSCITGNCYVRFWIGGGESALSADHTFNETWSGVPQGGIVSPVLSNILLSRLDSYVETVLIPQYTKGARRASNPEYQHLLKEAAKHRKKGEIEEAEELRRQAQQIPSIDINDPNYRRLRYVRYADDFLCAT
jgi:retron-type reverse transcriptase